MCITFKWLACLSALPFYISKYKVSIYQIWYSLIQIMYGGSLLFIISYISTTNVLSKSPIILSVYHSLFHSCLWTWRRILSFTLNHFPSPHHLALFFCISPLFIGLWKLSTAHLHKCPFHKYKHKSRCQQFFHNNKFTNRTVSLCDNHFS